MNFEAFLKGLHEIPTPIHTQYVYKLDQRQANPVQLSNNDIHWLVDFAATYSSQVYLMVKEKKIDLLTILLSMGTEDDLTNPTNQDDFLGKKDKRIEAYLIEKAKNHLQHTSISKSVVYGLSGNPPTVNHLRFIMQLLNQFDKVHIVLNNASPTKSKLEYAPLKCRLEMLQSMLNTEKLDPTRCIIEHLEIERDPPSRMIGTLSLLTLKTHFKYTLALGLDGLIHFTQWYKWDAFGPLCQLKVYPRAGLRFSFEDISKAIKQLVDKEIYLTLVASNIIEKEAYTRIQQTLENKRELVSIIIEPICTIQGSATDIRAYYATHPAKKHPDVHAVVDNIIRNQALYGY